MTTGNPAHRLADLAVGHGDYRIMNAYVPYVESKDSRGNEQRYDLFSRLLKEHIIWLGTPIDDTIANLVCAQMIHLESENPDRDISLYINSPGGDINAMFAIYDTMSYIRADVSTICFGQAASAAAVLLASGAKGKRMALPHSRVIIHQPHGQSGYSQASDIEILANEFLRMKAELEDILAEKTGKDSAEIAADTDRDFVMTAAQAVEYGIIDEVLQSREFVDRTGPIR